MKETLKITDLPINERPTERLLRYGATGLSNSELLAIILRTGMKNENIVSLSSRLLTESGGLNGLLSLAPEEIMSLKGIGKAKASQIIAICELSKRFRAYKSGEEHKIHQPKDVANLFMEEMKNFKEEHLRIVMLNTKNVVIAVKDASIGSLNSSIVHPREIFAEAIKKSSASIVVCHNHPSGDPTPSSEDIQVTQRLKECGKILGIDLLDHIIIGNGIYVSLKEKCIL